MKSSSFFHTRTKALAFLVLLFPAIPTLYAQTPPQTILEQKSTGKKITVSILSQDHATITAKLRNGKTVTIKKSALTKESLESLTSIEAPSTETEPKAQSNETSNESTLLNQAIMQPLFETAELWKEEATVVAKRLKWPSESKKMSLNSFRRYPKNTYRFLGARPYCATLYANSEGLVDSLSIVFANKGDFNSKVGMGEDHFKKKDSGENDSPLSLKEAIEKDETLLTQQLTDALGNPQTQYYGEKEDKRRVKRWDLSSHSFLLSSEKEEYVHLLLVPKQTADNQGKVKLIKDSEMKELKIANVRHEPNGDVLIDHIPMVNQGPKGYCAPATFERAMRYMGIPADMYLLATAATQVGGGTNTHRLAENCKRIVRSKARKIRDLKFPKELKIKTLKKYLDEGVPVLWQMRSLSEYNVLANKMTKQRRSTDSFDDWVKIVASVDKDMLSTLARQNEKHHICMIVGYNKTSNELAVSDSWGPQYELRWIPLALAEAVTSNGGFVIDF